MSLAMSQAPVARRNAVVMSAAAPRSTHSGPAPTGRREALRFVATVLGGGALLSVTTKAEALDVPFQESIGGREAFSTSEQSMLAYDMEGIKKAGLSRKDKKKLLADAKERALASAAAKK